MIDTWQIYDPSGDELIKIDIRGVEARPFGYALLCARPRAKTYTLDNASERVKQLRDELHRYKIGYIINAYMFFHLDIEEYIGARFFFRCN